MKQKIKLILILAIFLFILPLSFGASFQKQIPEKLEEPGIIQVQIEIQTEKSTRIDLAEMMPLNAEILNWNSSAPAELELQKGDYEYFGEVNVYYWKFEEINQSKIDISYELEISEYGEFETTTILIYQDGFSTEKYVTNVGDESKLSVFMNLIRNQLREPLLQLLILLIATGILISGIYYRYYKKYKKKTKKKPKKKKTSKKTKKQKSKK